jgi:hypothetical protein
MKRYGLVGLALGLLLAAAPLMAQTSYPDITLSGGYQKGHFDDVWDLTAGDITLSFTYDGNGLVDDAGAHAWAELGVRSLGSRAVDFNPYWRYTYWEKTTHLLAGQTTYAGDVVVSGDGATLSVKYDPAPGCLLMETHLHVADALAAIPQTKKGNPIPGQFEFKTEHVPPATEFTYSIDASRWLPTMDLYIAAHAVVKCNGRTETAWADGPGFGGANWATYFMYKPLQQAGSGVWLATDYDWTANTFDPDPAGFPTLDMDDKLILQRQGGQGEGAYNLPSTPPAPGNNHRVWWDRDGVDPWQNPATANTGGIYQVVITLHATSATTGTAYINIRGLDQGFETDGNWSTIELTPAGMTFTGDMMHLQVFYGMYGYGATHSVTFSNTLVTQ